MRRGTKVLVMRGPSKGRWATVTHAPRASAFCRITFEDTPGKDFPWLKDGLHTRTALRQRL